MDVVSFNVIINSKFDDAIIILFVFSLRGIKKSFKKMNITKLTKTFVHLRFLSFSLVVYIALILIQKRSVDEDYRKNCLAAIALDTVVTCWLKSIEKFKLLSDEQTGKCGIRDFV